MQFYYNSYIGVGPHVMSSSDAVKHEAKIIFVTFKRAFEIMSDTNLHLCDISSTLRDILTSTLYMHIKKFLVLIFLILEFSPQVRRPNAK